MKKNVLVFILGILLGSCSNIPDDVKFSTVKEEPNINDFLGVRDCAVEIKLNKRINKEIITKIANQIKDEKSEFKRLRIRFFLEDVKYTSIAWAVANFEPEFDVQINGSNEFEFKKMISEAKSFKGNVIGKWFEEGYTKTAFVLYSRKGTNFMRKIFTDGQFSDDELIKVVRSKDIKYSCSGNACSGEYYIINKKGELEFYNAEDKLFTIGEIIK